VTVLQGIGLFLVFAGVVEFAVFRYLAPRNGNIARRLRLLNANALLNVVVGVILLIAGA
jgi:putative copper export protein